MRKKKNDLKNLLETFFGSHFILLLPKLLERVRERERERERGPLFVMAALKAVTHGFVLSFMIS